MPRNLTLDLLDLDAEPLEAGAPDQDVSLETLMGGHALAENAASCQVCSCCIVCCCSC